MCFNQPMSFGFAAIGLLVALWINHNTSNRELASGVFFFFTMELLQGLQYWYIADDLNDPACETSINKVLTLLGYLHICLQPYFCHVINKALTKNPVYRHKYDVILRLCLIGGACLFARHLIEPYFKTTAAVADMSSTEWLRGDKLCTFRGNLHLAWSVPMADVSYYVPAAFIHFFLMYAPFLALAEKKGMIIQGLFLFLTGPFAASMITSNLMEQASIWCFFSIMQITSMLFLIREKLILHWSPNAVSLMDGKDKKDA